MTSLSARARNLASIMATAPTWRGRHVVDWWRTWRSIDRAPLSDAMPWLSWPCIDWLNGIVRPRLRVFEYGGGGSTLFFLAHGCDVTTVEGHAEWAAAIERRVSEFPGRSRLRFVSTHHPDETSTRAYVDAVSDGAPWDLILIDGAYRDRCVHAARTHVVSGGAIVVDNTDLPEYRHVHPEIILRGFRRFVFRGLGYARILPTTTEVFIAPAATQLAPTAPTRD